MAAKNVDEDEEITLGSLLLARGGRAADVGVGVDGGRGDGKGNGEAGEARRGGWLGCATAVADEDDDDDEVLTL